MKNENEYWIFDTSLQIRQIWNEICLCENKFTYNTPYILFIRYVHNQSLILVTSRIQIQGGNLLIFTM